MFCQIDYHSVVNSWIEHIYRGSNYQIIVEDGTQLGGCHGHGQHGACVQPGDGGDGDDRGLARLPGPWQRPGVEKSVGKYTDL